MNESYSKAQSLFGSSGIYCDNDSGICRMRYVEGRRGNNTFDEKACPV